MFILIIITHKIAINNVTSCAKYSFSATTTLYAKWNAAVASITRSDTTLYYESLPSAFGAVNYGETINVLKDNTVTSTSTIANGKTVTLSLNGHTVTSNSDINMFNISGELLVNSNTNSNNKIINTKGSIFNVTSSARLQLGSTSTKISIVSSSGNVINNAGTIITALVDITSTSSSPAITSSSSLSIGQGGTITSSAENTIQTTGGSITFNGATLTNTYGFDTTGKGKGKAIFAKATTITINSGKIISANNIAIEIQNCNTTVNDGKIMGDYRGINKTGGNTLTINGGEIYAENSEYTARNSGIGSGCIYTNFDDTPSSINITGKSKTTIASIDSTYKSFGIVTHGENSSITLGKNDSTYDSNNIIILGGNYGIYRNSTSIKLNWYDGYIGNFTANQSILNTATNISLPSKYHYYDSTARDTKTVSVNDKSRISYGKLLVYRAS